MQQEKRPVPEYYFSRGEWDRLGCGPLPPERDRDLHRMPGQEERQEKISDKAERLLR